MRKSSRDFCEDRWRFSQASMTCKQNCIMAEKCLVDRGDMFDVLRRRDPRLDGETRWRRSQRPRDRQGSQATGDGAWRAAVGPGGGRVSSGAGRSQGSASSARDRCSSTGHWPASGWEGRGVRKHQVAPAPWRWRRRWTIKRTLCFIY